MNAPSQLSLMIGHRAELLAGFAERSHRLQRLLRQAGYERGDGVSGAGLRLVSRVAGAVGLHDWQYTKTWADYDALIAAVSEEVSTTQPNHP